jgi:hypothetical protein
MSQIKYILREKVAALEEMEKHKNIIKELKSKIDGLNRQLYDMCEHNWIRDAACSDDDLGKKYCEYCGLRYYYNYK